MKKTITIRLTKPQAEYVLLALEAYQKVAAHADIDRKRLKPITSDIAAQVYPDAPESNDTHPAAHVFAKTKEAATGMVQFIKSLFN